MKRKLRLMTLTVLGAVLALAMMTGASRLLADALATDYAPERVNYQGYLTDSGGDPISGTVTLEFSLWDASTAGNQVWSETHNNVPVVDGFFSVLLGSQGTPVEVQDLKGSPRYLQLVYNGTIFPRQVLASAPYALISQYASEAATATTANTATTAVTATYAYTAAYALSGPSSGGVDWQYVVVVAKSGGDYTSISDALASITSSSSERYQILVMPGTYTGQVTLPEYVHLKGAGVESTFITSAANGNVNLAESSTLTVTANSQVSDLTVLNESTTNDGVAVRVSNGNSSTILNNVHARTTGAGGARHVGFYLNSGTPTLIHVYAEASGAATVFNAALLNSASSPTIQDSTFKGTGNGAVGLRLNGGNPVIKNSTISGTNGTNGQGINTTGGNILAKIDRSTIIGDAGTGSSIASTDNNTDFFVGASMLDGDVDVFPNAEIDCAQSYNGAYVDLPAGLHDPVMVKAKEKGTLMKHFQTRSVLVVAIALLLAMIAAGTLYAAGEQMPRSTFASGGGTVTSGGATLRSVIGASLGGGVISSSSGLGLCSGFGCGTQIDSDGGGGGSSGKKIYLPAVQK